jgi:hypothetical protein
VDRIVTAEVLPDTFTPPSGLDALGTLEEHLSQGWTYPVDVLVDATVEETSQWLPRSLGRLVPDEAGRTRLRASTDEPDWYAGRLAAIPVPFRVLASPELQAATAALGRRLLAASGRRPALGVVTAGDLDEVAAGVVEDGRRDRSHLRGFLSEPDSEAGKSFIFRTYVADCEGRHRNPVGGQRRLELLRRRMRVRFEDQLHPVRVLRGDNREPAGRADRDLGLLHEAEKLGIEAQRLVLVVHEDAGEVDPHDPSLLAYPGNLVPVSLAQAARSAS